jgi:hypothetical protein
MRFRGRAKPDARQILESLVGETVYTITEKKPNRIVAVGADKVRVDTGADPKEVPVQWVQNGIDLLFARGEVRIDVPTLGYRSSFIGAVLATLPGAVAETGPAYVRLRR